MDRDTLISSFDACGISTRCSNALADLGITRMGDLADRLAAGGGFWLRTLPNIGPKGITEIIEAFNRLAAPKSRERKDGKPNSLICEIHMVDDDGETSHAARHTVAGEILILQYGEEKVSLDHEQARALAWALISLCDAHE
jgi:hypothetical protein